MSAANQFLLLKDRRFLPLFVTQFTGAFNDNLFKSALSVMVAYGILSTGSWKPEVIVSLASGFLIFPYVVLAPLAGDLADKFDKAKLMRGLKIFELAVIVCAIIGLFLHSVILLLVILFLFGCQAALFAPAKFSILPQHLETTELIGGNALLNTGTYLAILAGTIFGSLLAVTNTGLIIAAEIFMFSGAVGYLASRLIPKAAPPSKNLKLRLNIVSEIFQTLKFAKAQPKGVFTAILGISWFYFLGATVLSLFPIFTKQVLQGDTGVLAFLMTVFSVGVALGGLLNNRLLHAKINARLVSPAAVVMALFLIDLAFMEIPAPPTLLTLKEFLSHFSGWRVVFDLLALSLSGGLYVIPLKSLLQHRATPARRARVMAAGALMDSLFILGSSGLSALLLSYGLTVSQVFLLLAVATFGASVYLKRLKRT